MSLRRVRIETVFANRSSVEFFVTRTTEDSIGLRECDNEMKANFLFNEHKKRKEMLCTKCNHTRFSLITFSNNEVAIAGANV